eukprot:1504505-Amphidinium_carterae.1
MGGWATRNEAGPRDGEQWVERLKEELAALIQYVEINKEQELWSYRTLSYKKLNDENQKLQLIASITHL